MTTFTSSFKNTLEALDMKVFPAARRRAALERFLAAGFPTTGWEAWRHTDVSEFTAPDFQAARLLPAAPGAAARHSISDATVLLVFINGFFAPALSDITHLPEGVEAGPLAHRPSEERLAGLQSLEGAPFAALNTALFPGGAFVRVTRGTAARAPIHLLFLTLPDNRPTLAAPRALVVVEEDAEAFLVETHAGGAAAHLAAAVTEVDLAPAARLSHVRRVRDLGEGAHVGHVATRQDRASVYRALSAVMGGALVRNHFSVLQAGEGAECALDGVVLARGRERADHQTVVDHAAPRGVSRETFKYLLDGRARGVFNGEVVIRPGAAGVDSAQLNANLLLSDQALMHTKPDLRIFADDVKAKHGATVGRLGADMLFYCRSRGLALADARRLLTQAFAADVVERVADEVVREAVRRDAEAWWGAA